MYKVLLVDDEVLVRVGMKALLDWEAEGFKVVGEASNGEAALEQIKNLEPDIVLTDVKMPVMDGLELIQKARLCGFHCQFVVLSSYDDFKYVKQALMDHARDYLLKLELEPETLLAALKKAASECRHKQDEEPEETPDQVLRRGLETGDFSEGASLFESNYQMAAACLEPGNGMSEMKESLVNMMKEVSVNYGKGTWTWDGNGFCLGMLELRDKKCVKDLWQASDQMMRYAFNAGCFMGISEVMYDAADIPKAREQAIKSAETARFHECGVIEYKPEYVREHSGTSFLYEKQFLSLEQAVKNLDFMEIDRELGRFIELFQTEILSPVMAMKICNIIHFIMNKGISQWGLGDFVDVEWKNPMVPMDRRSDYVEWLEKLRENMMTDENSGSDRFLIQTKRLILTHLEDGITLDFVAGKMGYSSSHFSRIFKQKTGVGFNLFLTRMKMELAKRYLEQEEWKIYDIAAKTGYENAAYFSRTFHQEVGMTPIEYRMRVRCRENGD